ncbi:MAG: hypothetical protein GX957_09855 [Clostridiaceae bacterium]|nr:hypothetical protein [Clostridiaceae bacterium]
MKKTRVCFAIIIVAVLLFSMAFSSKAETHYKYEPEAWQLHRLGLFAGASAHTFNPDLGAPLTRQVGITLLLNFFGKRSDVEALMPDEVSRILQKYKDQSEIFAWARPYLAYAVKTGMVAGTSNETISPNNILDGYSFAALILRHLGYTVDRSNFTHSIEMLNKIGGISSSETGLFTKSLLIKNDGIRIIYTTLFATAKDGQTVVEKLINSGHISLEKAVAYNLVKYAGVDNIEVVNSGYVTVKRPTMYDQIYYGIYEALYNYESKLVLPDSPYTDSPQKVFQLIEKCLQENPHLFYYSGCVYFSDGTVKFQYSKDSITGINQRNALKQRIEEIVREVITPEMSDYEMELALHDYLIQFCQYDKNGYEKSDIPPESYNAYGALCLGTAVCEGYAEAMKLLLNRVGIECQIITGTANDEKHAWNIVKIDGETYHLDATYNDPVLSDGTSTIRYHYFNLTDMEIEKDHVWNRRNYPACNSTKYNYYVYNSLIVSDYQDFIKLTVNSVNNGIYNLTLKIKNSENFNYISAVKEVCNRLYRSCTVLYNKELGIVDLMF